MKTELKKFAVIAAVFAACFFLPVGEARFDNALSESLHLVRDYAREHVLLCLVPAFFIAGAISVFISQASVMLYLGSRANKTLAYAVASVSGSPGLNATSRMRESCPRRTASGIRLASSRILQIRMLQSSINPPSRIRYLSFLLSGILSLI